MVNRAIIVALVVIAVDLMVRVSLRRRTPRLALSEPRRFRWQRTAINVIGFATLTIVAFTASSAHDDGLTGDRLIWHVASGPAFAGAAVVVALCWAHRNRFAAADWGRLASAGGWAVPARKFFFWVAVLLAVATLVSIVAAMFPVFDTDGQRNLLRIHRYCGPLLAAAGFLFWYFGLVAWAEGRKD
jgi:cytochrome b subunit of formate dehydrogenase